VSLLLDIHMTMQPSASPLKIWLVPSVTMVSTLLCWTVLSPSRPSSNLDSPSHNLKYESCAPVTTSKQDGSEKRIFPLCMGEVAHCIRVLTRYQEGTRAELMIVLPSFFVILLFSS